MIRFKTLGCLFAIGAMLLARLGFGQDGPEAQYRPADSAATVESTHRKMQRWEFFQDVRSVLAAPTTDAPASGSPAAVAPASAAPASAAPAAVTPAPPSANPAASANPAKSSESRSGSDMRYVRLPQEVFSAARLDLADLRLIDARGEEVPYQLRIQRGDASDVSWEARWFNQALLEGRIFEVSVEVGQSPREHNEVEVAMAGDAFRRLVELEGSDDGKTWRLLAQRHLVRYANDRFPAQPLDNRRITYPLSRFQYLRLRVHPDPLVDLPRAIVPPGVPGSGTDARPANDNQPASATQNTATQNTATQNTATQNSATQNSATQNTGTQNTGTPATGTLPPGATPPGVVAVKPPFQVDSITVKARFEIPEELVTWNVREEFREAVRARGAVASAWVVDLLAQKLPVDRLRVQFAEEELARDYIVETAGPLASDVGFVAAGSGTLSRRLGESVEPLTIFMEERPAARLRLVTLDFANQPPRIQKIEALAPARDVVFAAKALDHGPLRLYFGNPKAELPNYDFARNLPRYFETHPAACELSTRSSNPVFEPEPKPLTERSPWLIYVVLGASSLVVAFVLADIGRKAIAAHDAAAGAAAPGNAVPPA